jgi:hypothetical protein
MLVLELKDLIKTESGTAPPADEMRLLFQGKELLNG